MSNPSRVIKIRRALLSVSDKAGLVPLARALEKAGVELVATGGTAKLLKSEGLRITPIEELSGSPEAFQGRMKTLSFPVCSGILYRRGDASDEKDLAALKIQPIDCVIVNFYPFESALALGSSRLIEEVDIGGPTLVRAAAKNAPDVVILTSPSQYSQVIVDLEKMGGVADTTSMACAKQAWDRVASYDEAIAGALGTRTKLRLRYGENPHQIGRLEISANSPIDWSSPLTSVELSYNNILDLSSAFALAKDLVTNFPTHTGVVIVKHNNPCGVSLVPRSSSGSNAPAQHLALLRAWEGDPVSAFGGVLIFTDPIEPQQLEWLSQRFVELIAAPELTSEALSGIVEKRKKLKAVCIRSWDDPSSENSISVPGGRLFQTPDVTAGLEPLRSVTKTCFPADKEDLAHFGVSVCRALKSNAIALVRKTGKGVLQMVGAGQGQPNRIDALTILAVPRALKVLVSSPEDASQNLSQCVMVSDAFFPFRDTVDAAHAAGLRAIVQPGGSLKDQESIGACDEHGIAMAFTGFRHFKH